MSRPIPDMAARLLARSPNGRRPHVMCQRWEALLFLHWQLAPAVIQETLPPELVVDTFNGDAYLGIVPFYMRGVRPVGLPQVGPLSNFLELNVRTYVYGPDGTPGVWFYSLDCNQPIAVIIARLTTGLPYMHAQMAAIRGEFVDYSCRRADSQSSVDYRYRGFGSAQEAAADSLEFFLLERYYLFAQRRRSMIRAQVSHAPYQYEGAEVEQYSAIPAHLAGFDAVGGTPAHACYVEGLDVNIYAPEKISPTTST